MKKTKTELRGGNVTLGQLLVAAQKMASAIRVQEQNPGDFGWMSCKLLGGILRCLKENPLVLEKVKGKGKKNEIETVFYVFEISERFIQISLS